jgi:hypothetical protein
MYCPPFTAVNVWVNKADIPPGPPHADFIFHVTSLDQCFRIIYTDPEFVDLPPGATLYVPADWTEPTSEEEPGVCGVCGDCDPGCPTCKGCRYPRQWVNPSFALRVQWDLSNGVGDPTIPAIVASGDRGDVSVKPVVDDTYWEFENHWDVDGVTLHIYVKLDCLTGKRYVKVWADAPVNTTFEFEQNFADPGWGCGVSGPIGVQPTESQPTFNAVGDATITTVNNYGGDGVDYSGKESCPGLTPITCHGALDVYTVSGHYKQCDYDGTVVYETDFSFPITKEFPEGTPGDTCSWINAGPLTFGDDVPAPWERITVKRTSTDDWINCKWEAGFYEGPLCLGWTATKPGTLPTGSGWTTLTAGACEDGGTVCSSNAGNNVTGLTVS